VFNEQDTYVQFKLDMLKRATPADSAIVFGDIYMVDGGYSRKCLDYGCKEVLLIDTLETVQWQKHRIEKPVLDFLKGDFSNPHFMRSFDRNFDIGVVYDILLHQAPLLQTLHLMLEKVRHRFCIVQPMLREQSLPNTLVYLPGNTRRDLYPMSGPSAEFLVFDVRKVNHSHWLWGLTVSFLRSVLQGEGFDVVHEAEFPQQSLTAQWILWGCVAERKETNPLHWSAVRRNPGLQHFDW
jgi:hypothetical protein